jgi:hypothetical protein
LAEVNPREANPLSSRWHALDLAWTLTGAARLLLRLYICRHEPPQHAPPHSLFPLTASPSSSVAASRLSQARRGATPTPRKLLLSLRSLPLNTG